MVKAYDHVLNALKSQQDTLNDATRTLPTVPNEVASLVQQIKSLLLVTAQSSDNSPEISSAIQALHLELERKRMRTQVLPTNH